MANPQMSEAETSKFLAFFLILLECQYSSSSIYSKQATVVCAYVMCICVKGPWGTLCV